MRLCARLTVEAENSIQNADYMFMRGQYSDIHGVTFVALGGVWRGSGDGGASCISERKKKMQFNSNFMP